jgi:plastocyanin
MKRFSLSIALVLAVLVATSAAAAPKRVTIVIHHQTRGCHAWAVGLTGTYKASLAVSVRRGATLTFVNDDVMPQKIVQQAGAKVAFSGKANLNKPAASVKVTFAKPGVYTFGTVVGEDYVKGVTTIGEDNVLKLVVTVK